MAIAFGVFLVLLVIGVPIAFAIGLSGLVFFLQSGLTLEIAVQQSISTTQSFTMLAIPLFIFAGNLMNNTGITGRLIKFSTILTRSMYGSLGQVSCVLSTMMGGVSGSAVADAAMQSRILGPEMIKRGYARGWGAAINGVSGLIVATIPPSMGLIIYGTVGEVSIGRLFIAGYVPGIMMMIALMLAVRFSAKKNGYMPISDQPPTAKEVIKGLIDSIWAIMFPILLILLIRFGIMSPTESGAFAVAYGIIVGTFIYRELTLPKMIQTVKDSVKDISVITLILAFSGMFAYGVSYDNLPTVMAEIMLGLTSNGTLLLIVIVIFLAICGMFMETTVITLILTPILLPVVKSMGVDPVHFGIVMMTVVTSGVMTPPVGTALYVTSSVMGCKVEETAKHSIPFFAAIYLVLVIVIIFPDLVMFLPNLIYG